MICPKYYNNMRFCVFLIIMSFFSCGKNEREYSEVEQLFGKTLEFPDSYEKRLSIFSNLGI